MEQPLGKRSKGRCLIDMTKPIPVKKARLVSFSKRRSVLFKMVSKLSICYGAHLAVVVFSEAGMTHALGSPSVDAVLCLIGRDGNGDHDSGNRTALDDIIEETDRTAQEDILEKTETAMGNLARMRDIEDKVTSAMAGRRFWWEADVEALEEPELLEFVRMLRHMKERVSRWIKERLPSDSPANAAAPPPGTLTAAVALGTLNSN